MSDYKQEREELACAFRWIARLDMHEAVANHLSLVVDIEQKDKKKGPYFLINPNQRHFQTIRASDLLLLDAQNESCLSQPDAPDPTAWGLHGAIHRLCPHARCVMHVHSTYATALACLEDSHLPPIDQNAAMFFERYIIDNDFGGLAFVEEGERCAGLFNDASHKVMIMGNHGITVIGHSVAECFNTLYYFERAAKNYIIALSTGKKLRIMSHTIARKTAQEWNNYDGLAIRHFKELHYILEKEGSDYRL